MIDVIDSFSEEFEFLSNFFPSKITDTKGNTYPTVEHYFQAMKTFDSEKRKLIAAAPTPGQAKRLGRMVELREDWGDVKNDIMRLALWQKFSKPGLRKMLLDTGDAELIEGNWWHDTYWGVCNGEGENHLGKLLMEIRKDIKELGI